MKTQIRANPTPAKDAATNAAIYPLTIYFDGACPLCLAEMTNLQLRNTEGLLRFTDVSPPTFTDFPPGADRQALMTLMHVRRADGGVVKGADALRLIYAGAQLRGVARVMSAPGLRQLADWAYPIVARHRYLIPRPVARLMFETALRRAAERRAGASACRDGACELPTDRASHPYLHTHDNNHNQPKE